MSNLGEALWKIYFEKGYAEGYAKGYAEGYARGMFKTTARFYRDGIITADEAASDLGMTVDEFLEKAKQSENGTSED